MEIQNIFYATAIIFLFLTLGYFVSSYLNYIPQEIKVILSFMLAVILFILGDYLRRLDK